MEPNYRRAIERLSDPPPWLLAVVADNFPTEFEIGMWDEAAIGRMLRAASLAALNAPE
jgi:hypothetical protein